MKKSIIKIILLSTLLLTACGSKEKTPETLLNESNLSNVDTYIKLMNDYKNNNVPKQDYNCRTAAFTLLEDSISANPLNDYNNFLMFDVDSIENDDNFKQIKDNLGTFISVFDGASVDGIEDSEFENVYTNALKERNVKFNNDKASLISVVMHDPFEKWLFVGHAGVLIKQNNKYIFFEKLAPNQDYQITTFNSKEELKKELESRPAYSGDGSEHKPMIYENGELIK